MSTVPTPDEARIVDNYQRALTEVAKCAQAVKDGDWQRLAGAADQLARRAALLAVAAGELRDPKTKPRADVVIDEVMGVGASTGGGGAQLVRTLHPQRPSAPAAGVRGSLSNPFLHPDAQAGG